jgi:hypothetical protein
MDIEEKASALEITVDYYMQEFMWQFPNCPLIAPLVVLVGYITWVVGNSTHVSHLHDQLGLWQC